MVKEPLILEGQSISKSFDSLTLFSNLEINLRPGEKVCILGLSGSGKTTLMGILSGLREPDMGHVKINGIDVHNKTEFERAEYIGMVFQNFALIEDLSALENIIVAKWHLNQDTNEIIKDVMPILNTVGLTYHINKYPNQLSSGLKQRVALARALVNDPIIIFADEPTASLDTENSKNLMQVLMAVIKNKRGLIYSTHDLEIAKYADYVYVLGNGELNLIDKDRLYNSKKLIDLYS